MVLGPDGGAAQAIGPTALRQVDTGIDCGRGKDGDADLRALQLVVQAFGKGDHRVLGH